MSANIAVRPATETDIAAVQRVARETWHVTYAGHIPEPDIEAFLERAYGEGSLREALTRPTVDLLVATIADEVVGYAMDGVNRDGAGELFAIYVLPARQGAGIAWRLWQAATNALRLRGFAELRLWVLTANELARRFYERQGAGAVEERDWPVGAGTIHETAYSLSLLPIKRPPHDS